MSKFFYQTKSTPTHCRQGSHLITEAVSSRRTPELLLYLNHLQECKLCVAAISEIAYTIPGFAVLFSCATFNELFDYLRGGKNPPAPLMEHFREHLNPCPICNPYGYCPMADMASITLASYEGETLQHEIDALVAHQQTCPMCQRSLARLEDIAVETASYNGYIANFLKNVGSAIPA